ncbi:unnamed protein product [Phaeothamnion confervicola]
MMTASLACHRLGRCYRLPRVAAGLPDQRMAGWTRLNGRLAKRTDGLQPRMVGSLLTAMMEFSVLTAGMPVSYIELTSLAVTIAGSEATKVFCALLHDREDGAAFGRLIATEVLNAFVEDYANDLGSGFNLKDFHGFHQRIAGVIRKSAQPAIDKLGLAKGVLKAVLVGEDARQIFQTEEIDQLGVLANLQALIGLSTDIMTHCSDQCCRIALEGSGNTRTLLWRLEQRWTLVVSVSKAVHPNKYLPAVDEAVEMLQKLVRLTTDLHPIR